MNTRMEKYSEETKTMSRTTRNSDLYKTINKNEIDNYEIKSNATILGSNDKNNIDIEKIKKILDKRYKETPRRSIRIDTPNVLEEKKEEITKEYDINAILEKARNDKPVSYEEERAKKLRDTQYDILNNLNVEEEEEEKQNNESEEKLLDLINTITINESKNKTTDSGEDLFSDLKSDGKTETYETLKETEKQENKKENTISLDNTMFSKSMEFSKKDFEDFEEDEKTSPIAKVIIFIIVIIFLIVVFFFLKAVFNF